MGNNLNIGENKMATSQRVQILSDKSEEISILAQFLKNPRLIDELAAEVAKLNSLTEVEEARLHESKILIQQRDALADANASQKSKMEGEYSAHLERIASERAEADKLLAAKKAEIDDANSALDSRKSAADADETRLRQWENKLKETAAQIKGLAGA